MANLIKWNTPVAFNADIANAALASQATGSLILSSAVTNGTDLYPLIDIDLILGSITPGTGGYVEFHISYLMHDATNYAKVFAGGPTLAGVTQLEAGASIKYVGLYGWQIQPRDFKIGLLTQAGVTLAASGNSLQSSRYCPNANA